MKRNETRVNSLEKFNYISFCYLWIIARAQSTRWCCFFCWFSFHLWPSLTRWVSSSFGTWHDIFLRLFGSFRDILFQVGGSYHLAMRCDAGARGTQSTLVEVKRWISTRFIIMPHFNLLSPHRPNTKRERICAQNEMPARKKEEEDEIEPRNWKLIIILCYVDCCMRDGMSCECSQTPH